MEKIIFEEKIEMPKKNRRYTKQHNWGSWEVFDNIDEKKVYQGSYENASLACHNLNKKYYKELSVTTHNSDHIKNK
jgi:hypothetical protein